VLSVIRSLVTIIYLVAGAVIAHDHHYLSHLHHLRPIASAVIAVLLWPLILLGVNLHIR